MADLRKTQETIDRIRYCPPQHASYQDFKVLIEEIDRLRQIMARIEEGQER